jgi:ABC-type Mn2+/Zn2+ transport system permease subunit
LHGLVRSEVLRGTFAFSVLAAVMPAATGLYRCFILDTASAATIVMAAFVLLCLALPLGKLRAA